MLNWIKEHKIAAATVGAVVIVGGVAIAVLTGKLPTGAGVPAGE